MVTCNTHGDGVGGREGRGVGHRGWGIREAKRLVEGRVRKCAEPFYFY